MFLLQGREHFPTVSNSHLQQKYFLLLLGISRVLWTK